MRARLARARPRYPGELLVRALRDPLALILRMGREPGDLVRARLGPRTLYLVRAPDLIREVLALPEAAVRKERALRLMRPILGDGPLTSEGERHRAQKRRLLPAFARGRVGAYAPAVVAAAERTADRWREGDRVDVMRAMQRMALEATAGALLGVLPDDPEAFLDAVADGNELFHRHRNPAAGLLDRIPLLPRSRRLRRVREAIRAEVREMLARSRERGCPVGAWGGNGRDARVLDEAVTLLLAGHETTAVALTWTWHLLASHSRAEDRLHEELDRVLAGRAPTAADVPRLPWTRAVIAEAMRLRPPVWAVSRETLEAVELGGHAIPRGATLVVCQYLLHRDPDHWPRAERFEPERFLDGTEDAAGRFVYLPFAAGPRGCLGEGLARLELVLGFAVLAGRWRLRPDGPPPRGFRAGISLRPDPRLAMRTEARRPQDGGAGGPASAFS